MKTRVTVESLSDQFNEDREFARSLSQPSAAHAASISLSKLHGHMIDRKETGQPGDFAGLDTQEAVIAALRQELGDATADAFVAALAARDAEPEPEVDAPMPASPTDSIN